MLILVRSSGTEALQFLPRFSEALQGYASTVSRANDWGVGYEENGMTQILTHYFNAVNMGGSTDQVCIFGVTSTLSPSRYHWSLPVNSDSSQHSLVGCLISFKLMPNAHGEAEETRMVKRRARRPSPLSYLPPVDIPLMQPPIAGDVENADGANLDAHSGEHGVLKKNESVNGVTVEAESVLEVAIVGGVNESGEQHAVQVDATSFVVNFILVTASLGNFNDDVVSGHEGLLHG